MIKFMNKMAFVFLITSVILYSSGRDDLFYKMSNQQIDSLLQITSKKQNTISERMDFYSGKFLQMPYSLKCLGDGVHAIHEPWPLLNFQTTNCMVFCEHVLALSISDSWDNFFNNLQQIRYKDGVIGIRSRNHYTMADWLPENRWLLRDATKAVGGDDVKTITRTISHKKFFENKGVRDLRYIKPDRKLSTSYIPTSCLDNCKENLKTGDILVLIFANKDNIFAAHMLMVVEKDGELIIRESSNSKMTTFDTNWNEWVSHKMQSDRYLGVAVIRVRDDLNVAGKIILPWKVEELKN